MDYANERYVRVYVRDTKHWLQFHWEGQALLMMILRKCDRAGRIDGIEEPVEDLALMTGLPLDVVERGLNRLTRIPKNEKTSTVVIKDGILVIPNFIAAQETPSSDAERKRKSRELRRLLALGQTEKKEKTIPKNIPDDFEQFWKAYPRKTGKQAALKAWQKAKGKPPIEKVISILEQQKQSSQWMKDNGQFIPLPTTWLNQGRWDDEIEENQGHQFDFMNVDKNK